MMLFHFSPIRSGTKLLDTTIRPSSTGKLIMPTTEQLSPEVDAQLFSVVLNFGERREQHAGDNRVETSSAGRPQRCRPVIAPATLAPRMRASTSVERLVLT